MRRQIEHEIAAIVRAGPPAPRRPAHASTDAGEPWAGSHVQTLLFNREAFTVAQAKAWALHHGFTARKVHVTAHYVRIRQASPREGYAKRTIDLRPGVRAVVEQDA